MKDVCSVERSVVVSVESSDGKKVDETVAQWVVVSAVSKAVQKAAWKAVPRAYSRADE